VEPDAIQYLKGNDTTGEVIRRLVSGWRHVVADLNESDRKAIAGANPAWLSQGTRGRWANLAGVTEADVHSWCGVLFAHRIVTEDGVDPVAQTIVARIAIAGLPKDLREQLNRKGE
jgi:hypothetical protein